MYSSDNHNFYINKDVACISKHLGNQLNSMLPLKFIFLGGFKEGESKIIHLEIKSDILEICLKYLHYKVRLHTRYNKL